MKVFNTYLHRKNTVIFFFFLSTVVRYCMAQDTIKLNPYSPGIKISKDFTGMAYESDALHFDSLKPSNHTLIQFFKTAGVKTFRLGGNSVENYIYSPTAVGYIADSVTNTEIDSLFGFAEAVGCKIILGIDFGGYFDPSRASKEVSYVMTHYSSNLFAFEIGNEPNLYQNNGLRSPLYTYDSFQNQFMQYVDTIRKYTPNAPISGPAAARLQAYTYTNPFAHYMKGKGIINLLTQHYYAIPENVGTVSDRIDSLLSYKTNDSIKHLSDTLVMRADSDNVPFQMDECNALYPYSRWGLNNSFAASLWVLDYMYSLAEANVQGINLHTIYNAASTIINDVSGHYTAEPLYYGMLAFQLNRSGNFIPDNFIGTAKNLSVYPIIDSLNNIYVTLINKDTANNITFQLYADSTKYTTGQMISLTAAKVSDTFGVTLGSSPVTAAGTWSGTWQAITASHGCFAITIPKATALIIKLNGPPPLGINTILENNGSISLYPNPNNGKFELQIVNAKLLMVNGVMEVYNMLGKKVYSQLTINNSQLTIDLFSQPNGVYLYRVVDADNSLIGQGKLIIQK